MHYSQRNLTFVSSYYAIRIIKDYNKSFYIRYPSTSTRPSTRHWAGGRGALLWALYEPLGFGTARTYETTWCHVGSTICPPSESNHSCNRTSRDHAHYQESTGESRASN